MRQIKFRGKSQRGYDYSDGDGWIHGSLLQKDNVCAIVKTEDIDLSPKTDDGYSFVEDFGCVPVIPETIGQFTGSYDKNEKDAYHKDIVKYSGNIGIVEWDNIAHAWCVYLIKRDAHSQLIDGEYEIIGNPFDNPELLNEKQ